MKKAYCKNLSTNVYLATAFFTIQCKRCYVCDVLCGNHNQARMLQEPTNIKMRKKERKKWKLFYLSRGENIKILWTRWTGSSTLNNETEKQKQILQENIQKKKENIKNNNKKTPKRQWWSCDSPELFLYTMLQTHNAI